MEFQLSTFNNLKIPILINLSVFIISKIVSSILNSECSSTQQTKWTQIITRKVKLGLIINFPKCNNRRPYSRNINLFHGVFVFNHLTIFVLIHTFFTKDIFMK